VIEGKSVEPSRPILPGGVAIDDAINPADTDIALSPMMLTATILKLYCRPAVKLVTVYVISGVVVAARITNPWVSLGSSQ
jgi:hypothetical protein